MEEIRHALAAALLPPRDAAGHKGTFGKVCVIGGSTGYTGAPVYAAEAAVRTGSGLVFVGTPAEVYPIVAVHCAAAMAFPLPEDCDLLRKKAEGWDAALIGPGLGEDRSLRERALALLQELPVPVVLDADGINAAAAHIDSLKRRTAPTVLTPHEVEFTRLGGDLSLGREQGALRLAEKLGCVVVLKGPGTLVAHPDGRLRRNTTGSNALAKGGSGDVLAGMILSLMGQGLDGFDAASLGVYLHGRTGDLLAKDLTDYGLTPMDLVEAIPRSIRELVD